VIFFFRLGVFDIACLRSNPPSPYVECDLKEAIRQEICPIDHQLLARVVDDFKIMVANCIQQDGRRLTDIIFKTELSSMACFKL
jgi:hypothetical protein